MSTAATHQLLHELNVHQIELEMQNEELRNAQHGLEISRARYFDFYNLAPVGYCTVTTDGLLLESNLTAATMLGLAGRARVGRRFTPLIFKADQDQFYQLHLRLRGTTAPQVCELRLVRRDGATFWAELTATNAADEGGATVMRLMFSDITARRQAAQELEESHAQLRALLGRLQRAQEEERIRMAREIHDELGQLLTGLKMDLHWLERKLSEPGLPPALNSLLDRAVAASELADATIATVQRIAAEMRPSVLDELGLEAALHQEARRFQSRFGVECAVVGAAPWPAVPPAVANELFYICREALTNVARHASATRVELRWHAAPDAAVFEVSDDGIGLTGAALDAAHSLGLLGMHERALQCGCTIAFEANQPSGMRVAVRVPLTAAETTGRAGR